MALTPRGLSLVEPVREALLRIQATLSIPTAFDPGRSALRSPLVSADAVLRVMPSVFRRLAREAPGITCHVGHFSETSPLAARVWRRRPVFGSEQPAPVWLARLPGHPANNRPPTGTVGRRGGAKPSVNREQHHGSAVPSPASCVRVAERSHATPGRDGPPAHQCRHRCQGDHPGLLEIPFLLEGTELIATLPEHLARVLAKLAPVKVLPLPFATPETREVVIWHKRNEPDPGHVWLREIIIAVAKEA